MESHLHFYRFLANFSKIVTRLVLSNENLLTLVKLRNSSIQTVQTVPASAILANTLAMWSLFLILWVRLPLHGFL